MEWDRDAEQRVQKAPFFVRPFIRLKLEREAQARGATRVTLALVDELKSSEHRGSGDKP
ncbi:MAG TPA: PCP reductase family protein [Polyangiales bacterium]